MCVCIYIYKYVSQYTQLTVFKSQTRTADLHSLMMWLFGHLTSLKVCRALLSPCRYRSCEEPPHFMVPSVFAQQVVRVRKAELYVCILHVPRGVRPPGLVPPRLAGPQALPRVWLGADLTVQLGYKFSLQSYGREVLAPLKKEKKPLT